MDSRGVMNRIEWCHSVNPSHFRARILGEGHHCRIYRFGRHLPMADNLNTRVSQLEESMARAFRAIEALADKEEKLDDALTALIEAQLKTEQRFRETDQHFRETDQRF